MNSNYPLFFVILLLVVLIFIRKKEGLVTTIDEEINVPVIKNDLIVRIQLNIQIQIGQPRSSDAWLNIGDITLRDRAGNQIYYGNTNNVYFGNHQNWTGNWNGYTQLPVSHLWDNNKDSMAHTNREFENLIINLAPAALGSVQITNRSDCCEWRIGYYELALYNDKNEKIGFIKLDRLATQKGKTVLYKMSYPK